HRFVDGGLIFAGPQHDQAHAGSGLGEAAHRGDPVAKLGDRLDQHDLRAARARPLDGAVAVTQLRLQRFVWGKVAQHRDQRLSDQSMVPDDQDAHPPPSLRSAAEPVASRAPAGLLYFAYHGYPKPPMHRGASAGASATGEQRTGTTVSYAIGGNLA